MIGALVAAALAVLPSDRLAMADRLFNRGQFKEAATEYAALKGQEGVAADELLYRLAECDRAMGRDSEARQKYEQIFTTYPESKHAIRSRFMYAMGLSGLERRKRLIELDSDHVDLETRTAALYHLGTETSDKEVLAKCVKLDPKGKYAPYANLRYGTLLNSSKDAAERRKGIEVLLGIAFGGGRLADEALYLAALQSYREKKYGEAESLFRRYRKKFPKGENVAEARSMSAWCEFLQGKYTDAALTCAEGESDDLAYVRAACAYSLGENDKAIQLFRKYLNDYPKGRYRADAELPIARIEFDAAQKDNDVYRTVESARRGYGLSKLASDELRLAWAYERADKPQDAAAEYERVAKNFPGSEEAAEAMYRKAMISARADNWAATELALAEAMATKKLGKRLAMAQYWRGVAAMRIDHETEGVKLLKAAIEAGIGMDEAREAKLMIADYDYKHGRREQAREAYLELVRNGACDRMSTARILAVGKLLKGEEGVICAKTLTKSTSPEWRQAGWTLLGACEEEENEFAAATEAYRNAMAEKTTTEELAYAALHLGILQSRAGEHDKAEITLKRAISLNANNVKARAEAYLMLAKNAEEAGDAKTAVAYATVVTSLFDDAESLEAAKKIIAAHPEDKP